MENIEDMEKALSDERKASAGKDQKITALMKELEELKASHSNDYFSAAALSKLSGDLSERAGRLDAMERDLDQTREAYNYAIEKGVPISLAIGNRGRFAAFKIEMDTMAGTITKAVEIQTADILKSPDSVERGRLMKQYKDFVQGDPLRYLQLSKLRPSEMSRIPDSILKKIEGGEI